MRAKNRVALFCIKSLPNKKIDSFRVIVMREKKEAAIAQYKSQGYDVKVIWEDKP